MSGLVFAEGGEPRPSLKENGGSGGVPPGMVAVVAGADSGHRDHRDRAIVIARIGDRDRSEATRGGR